MTRCWRVALAAVAPFAFRQMFLALALATITTGILIVVATWESVALHRPAARKSAVNSVTT